MGDPSAFAAAIIQTLDAPLPAQTLREAARPFEIEASTDAYLDAMGLPHRAPDRPPDRAGPNNHHRRGP
jgi:hypothetical protein